MGNDTENLGWDKKLAKINHYEAIRDDIRNEIKYRISQRDNFSVQFVVALGVVLAGSLNYRYLLLAVPLVAVYYSVQILYSYSIHDVLAKYIREVIDPELTKLLEMEDKKNHEWESYYKDQIGPGKKNYTPGIRREFFILSLWVTTVISLSYLLVYYSKKVTAIYGVDLRIAIGIIGGIYLYIAWYLTRAYKRK